MCEVKYNEVVRLVNEILAQYNEATVRQIYYRMVSPPYQYMANTVSMYTSFDKMLTKAREEGLVNWHRIADHTRSSISPAEPYQSVDSFMENLKYNLENWWQRYTIDMWEKQDYRLRILVEKDALSRIIADIALNYKVSVIPGRGYNSFTQLMGQAITLGDVDKTIFLYFGDFDPSGLDIDRSAYDRLSDYTDADFDIIRVALTEDDIANLPPNPTKILDRRSAAYVSKYGDRCWELDALPPDELRDRVRQSIEHYIDQEKWQADQERLTQEKSLIKDMISKLGKYS